MRYWLLPLFLVCLAANLGLAQGLKKKDKKDEEPQTIVEFGGKTFPQWKKELHAFDPAEREVAFASIIHFPLDQVYDALPDILKELEKDKFTKLDLSVSISGVTAVAKIIQAKNTPTPEMITLMQAKKPDEKALQALILKHRPDPRLVERAVAIFRHFLGSNQVLLKIRTVQALPVLGMPARKALPEVRLAAKNLTTWEVRKEALMCLLQLSFNEQGKPDKESVKEFSIALNDNSAQVRSVAVSALGQLGSRSDKTERAFIAARLLKSADKDADHRVRIAANLAIMTANQEPDKKHLTPMKKYLQDPDPRVRLAAVQGLLAAKDAIVKLMPEIYNVLVTMVKDPATDVSNAAFAGLAQLKAYPVLKTYLHDPEPRLRVAAIQGLLAHGDEVRRAVPGLDATLAGMVKDPALEVSNAALTGLAQLKAYAALKPYLQDTEPRLRMAAIHGLLAHGAEVKKAMPGIVTTLTGMIEDPALEVGASALSGLVSLRAYDSVKDMERLKTKHEKSNPTLSQQIDNAISDMRRVAELDKAMKDRDERNK